MEEQMYSYRYPHPAVATDCVIFGFDGVKLKVLLVERGGEPYKGMWAFRVVSSEWTKRRSKGLCGN